MAYSYYYRDVWINTDELVNTPNDPSGRGYIQVGVKDGLPVYTLKSDYEGRYEIKIPEPRAEPVSQPEVTIPEAEPDIYILTDDNRIVKAEAKPAFYTRAIMIGGKSVWVKGEDYRERLAYEETRLTKEIASSGGEERVKAYMLGTGAIDPTGDINKQFESLKAETVTGRTGEKSLEAMNAQRFVEYQQVMTRDVPKEFTTNLGLKEGIPEPSINIESNVKLTDEVSNYIKHTPEYARARGSYFKGYQGAYDEFVKSQTNINTTPSQSTRDLIMEGDLMSWEATKTAIDTGMTYGFMGKEYPLYDYEVTSVNVSTPEEYKLAPPKPFRLFSSLYENKSLAQVNYNPHLFNVDKPSDFQIKNAGFAEWGIKNLIPLSGYLTKWDVSDFDPTNFNNKLTMAERVRGGFIGVGTQALLITGFGGIVGSLSKASHASTSSITGLSRKGFVNVNLPSTINLRDKAMLGLIAGASYNVINTRAYNPTKLKDIMVKLDESIYPTIPDQRYDKKDEKDIWDDSAYRNPTYKDPSLTKFNKYDKYDKYGFPLPSDYPKKNVYDNPSEYPNKNIYDYPDEIIDHNINRNINDNINDTSFGHELINPNDYNNQFNNAEINVNHNINLNDYRNVYDYGHGYGYGYGYGYNYNHKFNFNFGFPFSIPLPKKSSKMPFLMPKTKSMGSMRVTKYKPDVYSKLMNIKTSVRPSMRSFTHVQLRPVYTPRRSKFKISDGGDLINMAKKSHKRKSHKKKRR
jgi:hypothetical protein